MKHPGEHQLALFAGGELSLLERLQVSRHVATCATCESVVQDHREAGRLLSAALHQVPDKLNWDGLAAEMTGNILVGLAAGECVGPEPKLRRDWSGLAKGLGWQHASIAMAALTMVVVGAWWWNLPGGPRPITRAGLVRTISPGVILTANDGAIELRKGGSHLELLHRNGDEGTAIYGSAPGSLRVSFVDKDTGQVTINRVYAD
ncbi:MAG TPA: hypothetical protein VE621_09635 [Bryobacteraceae bacterium]|jgi:hypothetical protein|nr:hypothetical protein [Bryobacteraceae bacterium]